VGSGPVGGPRATSGSRDGALASTLPSGRRSAARDVVIDGSVTSSDLTLLVDQLRWDRRRHPYSGRRPYSRAARDLITECERLLATGEAAVAVPVLRKAVNRIARALMYLDDSSGIIGDDLRVLMGLYARACAQVPPSGTSLARWLVSLAYDGPGWPEIRLREFVPALGDRGLARLAALVDERAATAEPDSWGEVHATRTLREQLAEVSGDVDRYVAVLAEHLRGVAQYRRIAEVLRDAGRRVEAIEWARRGLAEKGDHPQADRLRDVLVNLLFEQDDASAAVAERSSAFRRHPTADKYRAFVATAARAGRSPIAAGAWAVGVLTDHVAANPLFAAELITVLRSEGRDEDAWQVGLVHRERLLTSQVVELLTVRAATHPGDVVQPYRELINDTILDSRDAHRYRRAIALLVTLRHAYQALGESDSFREYLQGLRVEHRRRPTFIAQLDATDLDDRDVTSGQRSTRLGRKAP
jgi:hypothetical protein